MNEKQLSHFRNLLEENRRELAGDIERIIQSMEDEPEPAADPNDRATQESDTIMELNNRNRDGMLIVKIDAALQRIASGDYGYCKSCGAEIGLRRLEARPTTMLCIDCKTLEETRARQMAH